jgi:SNF2 family DNA or RNA helicase
MHPKVSARNAFVLGYLTNGTLPYTIKDPYKVYTDTLKLRSYIKQTNGKLPEGFPLPNRQGVLHTHQLVMWSCAIVARRYQWAVDMGLGKTLSALELLEYAKENLSVDNTPDKFGFNPNPDADLYWVICPKNVRDSWAYELKKWECGVRPRLITNSAVSIDSAMADVNKPPFVLILDESHNFANATSQRSQSVMHLSNLMSQYWEGKEYVITMTGTPAPKNPSQWWTQTEIVRPGFLADKTQAKLLDRIAHQEDHGDYKKVLGWKQDEVEHLYQRLIPITSIYKTDQCIDLPPIIYNRHELSVSPELKAAAKIILETESHGARALQKLRQLSDGFLYDNILTEDEEIHREVRTMPCPKDDWIISHLEELLSNERYRTVIYGAYRASIDKLTQLIQAAGWNIIRVDGRGRHVIGSKALKANQEQFLDKDLDTPIVWLAHPASGGVGVTLHSSQFANFYSNTFNGDHRIQSIKRINRMGMGFGSSICNDLIHLPTDDLIINNLTVKRNLERISMGEVLEVYEGLKL